MFIDSLHLYELGALKVHLMPLIDHRVTDMRLKKIQNILSEFDEISPDSVPQNSLLREFIGYDKLE